MTDPATTAAAALILLASGSPENAPVLSISTEVSTELPPELQPPVLDCVIWPDGPPDAARPNRNWRHNHISIRMIPPHYDKGRHRHRQRPHHRHRGWRFDDQP